jgi:cathepsin D
MASLGRLRFLALGCSSLVAALGCGSSNSREADGGSQTAVDGAPAASGEGGADADLGADADATAGMDADATALAESGDETLDGDGGIDGTVDGTVDAADATDANDAADAVDGAPDATDANNAADAVDGQPADATDANNAADAVAATDAANVEADAAPSTVATVPLTGCPSSGYAAAFTVGGQPFNLIVDTGSADLAVASNNCPTCAGVTPVYTPGATATDNGRQVTSQYGIGSWTGELYTDDVVLTAASLSTSMKFVAIQSQAQFFSASGCNFGEVAFAPQGIAGFGPTTLATGNTDVFMSRLVSQGLAANTFAVELCPIGGQLWIGGVDAQAAAVTGTTQYTPLTTSGYYSVTLSDVQLGGQSINVPSSAFGTTIVDTGTTALALPTAVFNSLTSSIAANAVFATSFQNASGNWLGTNMCYASSRSMAELDAMLPGLTLVMPDESGGTMTVALTATESYLAPGVSQGTTYYCSGLLQNAASTATTILGVAAMSAHLVVFDGANGRIGFAPQTHCR